MGIFLIISLLFDILKKRTEVMFVSNTYIVIKEIIKREVVKDAKLNFKGKGDVEFNKKLGVLFLLLGISFVTVTFSKSLMLKNLSFIAVMIDLVYLLIQETRPKENEEILTLMNIVYDICRNLIGLDLYSLEVINSLQEEILHNIEMKKQQADRFFKRISVIFVSFFWIPFGFLFKYLLESNSEVLTWNNFVEISLYLLLFAVTLISTVIAINRLLEYVSRFEMYYLKLINSYVNDVKYLILSKKEIPMQASADEHAPSVGGEL